MTDCKHENITLDDINTTDCDRSALAECPECRGAFFMSELQEMGYKLVKTQEGES